MSLSDLIIDKEIINNIGLTDLDKLSVEKLRELKEKVDGTIRVKIQDNSREKTINDFVVGDEVSFKTKLISPGFKRRAGERQLVTGSIIKINRKYIRIYVNKPKEMANYWNVPPYLLTVITPSINRLYKDSVDGKTFMDELKGL